MDNNTSHHDPLLIIRALACLSIIWYHMSPPLKWLVIGGRDFSAITQFDGGPYVFIFYLLSGYSIGYVFFSQKYSFHPASLWKFYVKRLIRMAPAYYLVIFICYQFIYADKPKVLGDILRYVTFTANGPAGLPFGGTHAIVSTEMQFYIAAPLLLFCLMTVIKKVPTRIIAFLIFFVSFIIRFALVQLGYVPVYKEWAANIYTQVHGNLDLFLFGALMSFIVIKKQHIAVTLKKKIFRPVFFVALLLGALVINYLMLEIRQWAYVVLFRVYVLPVLISLSVGLLILIVTSGQKVKPVGFYPVKHVMLLLVSPRTFLYGIGILSYGIYLWHYPIFYYFFLHSNAVMDSWPHFFFRYFVVLISTLIAALLSYALLERPLLTGVYADGMKKLVRGIIFRDLKQNEVSK